MYLDDILVFGPDFGTTLARLERVLDRLAEAGLKLKAKKCQLFQEEIQFLGHIVSAAGIGADPAKCHVGTGAVLSQVQDEEEQVIAYVSKSLEGSQQRYCTARKELLAVVRALKHFKCHLYGQKITVPTGNSAVSWLHRSKDPVGQPARWIEVIDTYDITFQHRPDCPSSIPKWAPVGPIRGPFGAQLCPTGAQPGPTWNAAWVEAWERRRPLPVPMPAVWGGL